MSKTDTTADEEQTDNGTYLNIVAINENKAILGPHKDPREWVEYTNVPFSEMSTGEILQHMVDMVKASTDENKREFISQHGKDFETRAHETKAAIVRFTNVKAPFVMRVEEQELIDFQKICEELKYERIMNNK